MTYKVIHKKETCIGCGACVSVCPEYFEMSGDKAHLKDSRENEDGCEICVFEHFIDEIEDASQVCPVSAISAEDSEKNKQ